MSNDTELKDIRQLMKQEHKKIETAKEFSRDEIREQLMASKDLEDVVLGPVGGPLIPAKYDRRSRIFFPVFKKANK